jgi:hypothetical protein
MNGKICWLCCVLSPAQLSGVYELFLVNKSVTISSFNWLAGWLAGWLALSLILGFGGSWRGSANADIFYFWWWWSDLVAL